MMALLSLFIGTQNAHAQSGAPVWDDQFAAYGVDGIVLSAVVDNGGVLYIGGEFSRAGGIAADGIARWDGSAWATLGGGLGAGFSGVVHAMVMASDGSLFIGGEFAEVFQGNGNLTEAFNVARWTGSSWEPLGTGVDGPVYSLAEAPDGVIYIGGEFGMDGSGEFELSKIAAWDGANLSSVGNGLGTFSGVQVRALAFDSQGDLFAGGAELAGGIFKWDGSAWATIGARHQGVVNTLAFDSNDALYAGGDFQAVIQSDDAELQANRIARWNGASWETLGTGFDGEITAMGFDMGGMLHVTGLFGARGDGALLRNLARWNGDWEAVGNSDDENLFESLNALAFTPAGGLYALGDVQHLGGTLVNGVGYWDGQRWQGTGGMGLDDAVKALAFDSSGILYAGGSFAYSGPRHAGHVAAWIDNAWAPLGEGVQGIEIRALTSGTNRKMYVGGDFAMVLQNGGTGLVAYNFAIWDAVTQSWSTPGTGVNGDVHAIAEDANGNVYIGGAFTQDGSEQEARNFIAMWDGTAWSTPGGGMDGPVYALAVNNAGEVIAGGAFTQAGTVGNTAYLAKWDGAAWAPLSDNTVLDATVHALHVDAAGGVYVGGEFTQVGTATEANYIARWADDAWAPLGSPNSNGLSGCCVYAISGATGEAITVGGDFEGVRNPVGPDQQANRVAIWQPAGGWSPLDSGVDDRVLALASNGEDVLVGGDFRVAGGLASSFVGRWSSNEMLVSTEEVAGLPEAPTVLDIYPNPAASRARLNVAVNRAQEVRVTLFDMLGRRVEEAFSGYLAADEKHVIELNASRLSAGMYMVRIQGDSFTESRSLVLVK
ncbi:MAG: T9SS type A sorting domain-containing protein [Bacteroidota bacterium]